MANGYVTEIGVIQQHLPTLIERILPPPGTGAHLPKPQYVLMVNGQVPRHEPARASVNACRSSLRRLLRRQLQSLIYPTASRLSWDQWRRYKGPALERVIKMLEENGTVEYRPLTFGNSTNTAIVS